MPRRASPRAAWFHISRRLGRDQLGRDVDRRVRRGGVDDVLAELALELLALDLGDLRGDLLAHLGERVEAARVGGEVVVQLGQLLLLDLLDLGLEDGLLAGEVLGAVVVGERDLDLARVTGRCALELLLEAGDQPLRAELEQISARVAALERLAVHLADEVEHHEVALPGGAVDVLERCERIALRLELAVDLLLRRGGLAAAGLDALVLAELRLRAHADLDA